FDPEEWVRADTSNDYLWWSNLKHLRDYGIFQMLQYNYTDNPNGVEVAGFRIYGQPAYEQPYEPFPINVYLYDSEVDTFVLKVDTLFDVPSFFVPHQFDSNFLFNPAPREDDDYTKCIDGCRPAYYILMYEDVFFEKPVRVFDSFYVGMDYGLALFSDHDELEPMPWCTFSYDSQRARPIECRFPPILWKYRLTYRYPFATAEVDEVPLNQWVYLEQNDHFICLLPLLVSVDTTAEPPACPEVRNLRVYRQYGDEVTLKWDSNGGRMWEVSHGPLGTAPGDGMLDTVTSPQWRTADSSFADTTSIAYVRTICTEYDTLRYSDWSRGVKWNGSRVGIERLEAPQQLRAIPNPAYDKVALEGLGEGYSQVHVYDSRGSLVLSTRIAAADNTIDIGSLAPGAYVIRVVAANECATLKVVKAAAE
ncbi:MAG: T9SS type A sorting domain-containing protein, partial [Bacteroidales bacterium]|nr:T9SS type A sorting domain-containing protein [Bacteroidales bacterium]